MYLSVGKLPLTFLTRDVLIQDGGSSTSGDLIESSLVVFLVPNLSLIASTSEN